MAMCVMRYISWGLDGTTLYHLYSVNNEISREGREWEGGMPRDIRAGDESAKIDKRGSRQHCGSALRIRNPPRASATVNRDVRWGTDYWQTPCERMHLTGGFRRALVRSLSPSLPVEENSKFPPVVFAPRRFIHFSPFPPPLFSLHPSPPQLSPSSRGLYTYSLRFDGSILRCVRHGKFSRRYIFTTAWC